MQSGSSTKIALIIVNYGTAELAIEAVESVLGKGHGGRQVDVHLVDNASPGEDAQIIQQAHAEKGWGGSVTLYLEQQNHGFGRGNNVVLRALANTSPRPDYAMFLNPDARLENEAIDLLASFLDTHPEVGFAGAGISKPDGTAVTAAFRFPNAINEFSQALNFGPVARALVSHTVPLPATHPRGQVDWVSGAAVMARLDVLTAVNFFDPDYFLYFEEVDLMYRARQAGAQTWFIPEAKVIHSEGASTGVKSGRTERRRTPSYWYTSWYLYYSKNMGRIGVLTAGLAWITGAALNYPLAAVRGQTPHAPLGFFQDFWAGPCRRFIGLGSEV